MVRPAPITNRAGRSASSAATARVSLRRCADQRVEVSSSRPQPASSARESTNSAVSLLLWPEEKIGSRVTICRKGGTPNTTASQSAPNRATHTRSSVGRMISAAAASMSGRAPT